MDAAKLMELMRAKKASLSRQGTLKPKPGNNRYVLLPGWRKGEEIQFWHDFGQHYVKDAAGGMIAVHVCEEKTFNRACPVCSAIVSAVGMTTNDDALATLREWKSGESFLMSVLALDSDQPNVPQILELRKSAFGQLVTIVQSWGVSVFDPTTPQVIAVNREGTGLLTKYSVQITPDKYPMPRDAISKIHNLDDYVKQTREDQKTRAIEAINNVVGLIAAPSTATGVAVRSPRDQPRTHERVINDEADEAALRNLEMRREVSANKPSVADLADSAELDDILAELTA